MIPGGLYELASVMGTELIARLDLAVGERNRQGVYFIPGPVLANPGEYTVSIQTESLTLTKEFNVADFER